MGGFWKELFGTEQSQQSPEVIAKGRIEQSPEVIAEERIQAAHRSGALELDLDKLELRQLPPSIGQLTQLQMLDVSDNQLTVLPESLRKLTRLQKLYLHDNPKLGLPPEVLGPTWLEVSEGRVQPARPASILEYYFRSRASQPLNEAKMILIGRGGVGKTSLVQRLVHSTFDPHERKTDGIAITPWQVEIGRDRVRLNIWDFGGQEIMHATHQFFLTKRSPYLLVLNAREGEQDANVEYWLRIIESFGGDSPVIVVINKVKDHPFDLNRRGLQEKFPAIRDFVQTDCDAKLGFDALQRTIERETDRLEHLRDPFPASWFTIKDRLANLRENFITYEHYQELCTADGLKESTGQGTLVGFLHDLGIVVNFRDDPRLVDTHVLNPHWVTNGIYKILNAETVAKKKGELSYQDLPEVLDPREYPRRMHRFLLDLMEKFELCYEFYGRNGEYLVPELLGKEEPELKEFVAVNALRFEYHYNILPEGLLPRFIVRSRALIQGPSPWRTGVVLAFEGNRAMVKADIQDRKVSIAVIGEPVGRRRLLAVIRSDFEHIHRSIARLRAEEMVPMPEHPGVVVPYTDLRTMEAEGYKELLQVIGGKVVKLDVTALLSGVEEPAARTREARTGDGRRSKGGYARGLQLCS